MKEHCPNMAEKPKRNSLMNASANNPTKLDVILFDFVTSSGTVIAVGSLLRGETKLAVVNGAIAALSSINSLVAHASYKNRKNHDVQLTS